MYDIHLRKRHVESLVSGPCPCPFPCPLSTQVPRIPFPAPDPTTGVKFSRNTLLISCLETQTEKRKREDAISTQISAISGVHQDENGGRCARVRDSGLGRLHLPNTTFFFSFTDVSGMQGKLLFAGSVVG